MIVMTCNDAYASIVRTIDDAPLTGEERAALRRHLESCACCRGEYETQHEVRRLLVLHIQDQLPAGFDARLSARLARASRPSPSGLVRDTVSAGKEAEAPSVMLMFRRAWALRLVPLAATLALFVADTAVRDVAPPPAVALDGAEAEPIAVNGTKSARPRAFTTIEIPHRYDGATRRHRPSPASTDDVTHSEPQATVEDGQPYGGGAVADSEIAIEDVLKTVKVVPGSPGAPELGDRVPASERRETGVNGELAVSQRPGILPPPAAPFPQGRPAMPAPTPPAVIPDRSIPPW